MSKEVKTRRNKNVSNALWLVINEMSMLTADTLMLTLQITGLIKTGNGNADLTVPFGGMNTLLMGDFHQFPPVSNPCAALYNSPTCGKPEPSPWSVECSIYLQFQTVVTLVKQQCITHGVWMNILERARTGDCMLHDLWEICKLVLTNPQCELPNPSTPPWDDMVLITAWNVMQQRWNEMCLQNHC